MGQKALRHLGREAEPCERVGQCHDSPNVQSSPQGDDLHPMGTRARRPASEVGHGDAKPPVDQSGTQLGEVRLDTSMALGEISSHDEQMIEGRHGKTLD